MKISRRSASHHTCFSRGSWSNFLLSTAAVAVASLYILSAAWKSLASSSSSRSTTVISTHHDGPFVSTPPVFSSRLQSIVPSKDLQSTPCADVRSRRERGDWHDPNNGYVYARSLISSPPFTMAVHNRLYDHMRWKSIYQKGYYYETDVHNRFVRILKQAETQLVLDVGMNIGYYTQLSAALGHDVIGFEINPANVMRLCESASLNRNEEHIAVFRRGVSNVDDEVLPFVVPKNPGEAKLVIGNKDTASSTTGNNNDDPHLVKTITLDTFARKQGWLSNNSEGSNRPTIPLLKIDVEGHEPEIILGAQQLLKSGLVQNILTEYRDFNSDRTKRAFDALLDAGYTLVQDDHTLLSKTESQAYYRNLRRKRVVQKSLRKQVEALFNSEHFYMDLWFTCATCQTASDIVKSGSNVA